MFKARRFIFILALLTVMVLGATLAAAQDAESIAIGDTVQGTLSDDARRAQYSFEGSEGQDVTITLTSDDFDAYLLLLDEGGEVLAEDDDSAGQLDSQIVYSLPDDAEYTIVATSLREYTSNGEFFQAGDFTLELTAEDGSNTQQQQQGQTPTPTPESQQQQQQQTQTGDPGSIAVGDTVEGTLDEATPRATYALEGAAGQEVTITLTSPDFDAYLVLTDEAGDVLAEDDDSAGRLDSQIVYTFEDAGTYTIIATSLREFRSEGENFASGSYTLAVTGEGGQTTQATEEPTEPTDQPQQTGDGTIALGGSVDGTLEEASTSFTFEGEAGQTITATLTSTDFDPYLQLVNASGDVLAEDDDSAGRLNSQIVFELPESGSYALVVTSFRAISSEGNEIATGNFNLQLSADGDVVQQPTGEPTEPAQPAGDTIAFGDRVNGTLEEAELRIAFEATAGQIASISLESNAFDPYVLLEGPGGEVIAEDDDSGDSLNSLLVTELPENGTYTIVITSFSAIVSDGEDFATGDFTLTLTEESEPRPIDPTTEPTEPTEPVEAVDGGAIAVGDTVEGTLTEAAPSINYTFEGQAGELVTITMISEDFDTYLILFDGGTEVARDDDSAGNLDSRIGPIALPESGTYTILATSFGIETSGSPGTGSFTLSVTAATVDPIEYTQSIEGTISPESPVVVYRFTGSAGDIVSATLNTASFSLYGRLTGEGANLQTSGGNAVLGPFTLPTDGEYLITVTSYDTTTSQSFSLTLNRIEPEPIVYGYRIRTSFAEEGQDVLYYSFEAGSGDSINVRVESFGEVDLRLALIGPGGFEVASDDDGGPGFDPELNYQVSEAGTYQLVVRPYIPGDDGTFNLYFANAAAPDLEAGTPQILRLSDKQFLGSLVFDAVAGETIQLSARLLTPIASEPRITVTQNGITLAEQSIGRVTNLTFAFVVPEDGRIEVTVQDFNGNPVVIEFTLTRPDAAGEGQ
ncbi:MAG: PPC domain-containing protein [bacterium]|nr:PPC domain-containing protein [bacterium]